MTYSRRPKERSSIDDDVVAALDEGVDEIRADEPGASGDGRPHTPYRRRAVFITFEGQDGSGKTTQAALLADWLREQGREVVATREPGGTPLGEAIRDLVLHGLEMSAWAEATLFASARAEHVESVIRPALERGRLGRLRPLRRLVARLPGDRARARRRAGARAEPRRHRRPDAGADLRAAARRRTPRASRQGGYLDRIEREDEAFRASVADGYRELAVLFPERVAVLDGSQPAGGDRGAGT